MLSFCLKFLAVVVGLLGILIATSPAGVSPVLIPETSTTGLIPPWPIFRVAVALNEFFEAAAVATRPPPVQIKSLATAYWQSEVAYSLTKSGIIDAVGTAGGVTCAKVATSLSLNVDFTCRMMRAGESLKLVASNAADYTYSLTPAGDLLRTDHPMSAKSFMLMINEETRHAWRAAGTKALGLGKSGFSTHFGEEFWEWHSRPAHAPQMAQFDGAMTSFSAEMAGSLLSDWQPPSPNATVCDVGGGVGHMLVAMAQHYPELRGVVFDLPPVAERAKERLQAAGLTSRLSAIGGSFFDALPSEMAACDAFYLKFILHDWPDKQNVALLKRVREVAKPGASIVSTDFIMGVDGAAMETSKRLMDINMMASNPAGARERSWEEYRALFVAAGVAANKVQLIKMRDLVSTVEAKL